FFNTGTFPGGFLGYTAGFTAFYGAAAVAGSYQLTLNVFSSTSPTFTTQATGTLSSKAALPLFATPTFTEDTKGGGTASVTVPAGCTEALVYIVDLNGNTNTAKSNPVVFYTVEVTGSGTQTATLPDSLGPAPGTLGPQPSLNAGDPYLVYAVGFDYPAFEAGPPANTSAAPPITGSNGQADLTMSGFAAGTYGSGITGGGLSRTHFVLPGRRLP
ncbi:MAG: hypothetical protein ACREM2_03850, partial [Vulcanimicrobiaceae bacterium]